MLQVFSGPKGMLQRLNKKQQKHPDKEDWPEGHRSSHEHLQRTFRSRRLTIRLQERK